MAGHSYNQFEPVMKGSIHSDQTCPLCGGRFRSFEPQGLWCPDHPEQRPSRFTVRFGRITRRFNSYQAAFQFLTGLRFEAGRGSFDLRDYQVQDKPLSFVNLAAQWLALKKRTVRPGTYRNLRSYLERAAAAWGQANIKNIGYGQIEDLIFSLPVSAKTRHNFCAALKEFWSWLERRENIKPPRFPEISFNLEYRRTVDLETQECVLSEIHRLSYNLNPKIWLGIKWLCTYISIRPGEMLSLKEENLDRARGLILIPHPKEGEAKVVPMLDGDRDLLREQPHGLPGLAFFRHTGGVKGTRPGRTEARITMSR